jgi:putative holliday junction resolvase
MSRLLGLDVGDKRMGVAICDETQTLARPLLTLNRASKKEDFAKIAALCREHAIEKVIVGLPKTLRNEEGPQAQRVRRYAAELQAALSLPIEFWDERFSTAEARDLIIGHALMRKNEIDAIAAAVILQDYLDGHNPRYAPI